MDGKFTRFARMAGVALVTALVAGTALGQEQNAGPQQVGDLYLRTFINRNLDAAKALSAYYKRVSKDGREAIDMEVLKKPFGQYSDDMLADAPASQREALKRLALSVLDFQNTVLDRTRCKVDNAPVKPHPYLEGEWIADLAYSCTIPWPSAAVQAQMAASKQQPEDFARGQQAMDALVADVKSTSQTRTVHQQKSLYAPAERYPWSNGSPGEFTTSILDEYDVLFKPGS